MGNKVIISAALTGALTPKAKNANVPVTPQEIADDTYACWKEGAAVVHLHMRDENAMGTMDAKKFAETVKLIRAHEDCDVIINCTSSGDAKATEETRKEHFLTVPGIEVGSYDIDTFNWDMMWTFENSAAFLQDLAKIYKEKGIRPEVEIFDEGMLTIARSYVERGILEKPVWCQFVMGLAAGGMEATVENLHYLASHLPEGFIWSCTGIGSGHLPMVYAALALGGHIRVGLEDNLYYDRGVKASNTMLVARAARIIKNFGKEVATPAEAREIIGLKPLVR